MFSSSRTTVDFPYSTENQEGKGEGLGQIAFQAL
jgi:hypothetical protein